jgi:metallophosphoesterase superfamily enzyme
MTAALANRREETFLHLAGELLVPLPEGGLWWPGQRLLVVSDLHLEKGSSYASRGQMLPPMTRARRSPSSSGWQRS